MSNLEMIEKLCSLVEHQASVIHHLSVQLVEARCLTEAEQQMIDAAKNEYTAFLGAGEIPDYPEYPM